MKLRLFLVVVLSIPMAIALTVTAAWFPRTLGIPSGVWTDACVAREFAGRPWRFAAGGDSTIDLFKADGVPSMEFALESAERISKSTPNPRVDATRPDWSSLEAACKEALAHLHEYPPGGQPSVREYAAGWPMRCFHGTEWAIRDGSPNRPQTKSGLVRIAKNDYPCGPIAAGLTVNIGFFSVIAFVALCGMHAAWRGLLILRANSKRGRCPKCGYDRTGITSKAVCPECGAKPLG